ncbi:MAG: zeta toxin family protein [Saprospiraceae bacterium]|nr:zeta toxin family protein [Saprospiraceae bacterium]
MPNLYIIAGCNGAGKTTASMTILPEILDCQEFVNADEIAKGLSPFHPEKVSIEAGRIMLNRINQLLEKGEDFAFETTLSTRSYVSFIKKARNLGYKITLVFVYLKSVDLAKQRVAERVKKGGHNIETEVIERRYVAGLKNFRNLYFPICNEWIVFDNSDVLQIVAQGNFDLAIEIYNSKIWKIINEEN